MLVFLVSCLVLHVAGCGPSVEADLANIVLVLQVKARPGAKLLAQTALVKKEVLKAVALAFGWPASSQQVLEHTWLGVLL